MPATEDAMADSNGITRLSFHSLAWWVLHRVLEEIDSLEWRLVISRLSTSHNFSVVGISQFLGSVLYSSSSPVMITVAVTLQRVLSCDSQQDCELPGRRYGLNRDCNNRAT
ncbi:hypothetical protein TIFTF001_042662 [Ficus carica]|uniref:Uncharacterized protein n=1 Tax=Ficus carica TaxID=3494 RepID=A0AA88A1U4_FICCA|nr:hypothetical protein TIFTF001_042662 [Ficus carica]